MLEHDLERRPLALQQRLDGPEISSKSFHHDIGMFLFGSEQPECCEQMLLCRHQVFLLRGRARGSQIEHGLLVRGVRVAPPVVTLPADGTMVVEFYLLADELAIAQRVDADSHYSL